MRIKFGSFEARFGFGKATEKRSVGLTDYQAWLSFFGQSEDGTLLNENSAMRITTTTACLKVLGESVASLPSSLKKKKGNTRTTDSKNPVHHLISTAPNPYMTAYNWKFAMTVAAAGWGEAYSVITRDAYGMPTRLDIVHPSEMKRVNMPDGGVYLKHKDKVYNTDDVICLKPFSVNGKDPISLIRYSAETFNFALKQQTFRNNAFKSKPPGYLSTENLVKEDQLKGIRDNWQGQTADGTPVLYNGLKYHPLSFSPADLQLLEATKATQQEICSLFRVPPTFLQNYERATFSNAEQQDLVFAKYTLLPIITNFEQELDAKLLPYKNQVAENPKYFSFDMKGLLQGDFKTRTEGYRTLWQIGAISADDIRALEDMNPVDGGDKYYVPMNMIATDKAEGFYDKLMQTPVKGNTDTRGFENYLNELIKMNGYTHH